MNCNYAAPGRAGLVYVLGVAVLLSGCADIATTTQPAPAVPAAGATNVPRSVVSGTRQQIGFFAALNPDCSPVGPTVVKTLTAPTHGTVAIENSEGFTNFPQTNQRYACNLQKSPMVQIFYTSVPGYKGSDEMIMHAIYADGSTSTNRFVITVE